MMNAAIRQVLNQCRYKLPLWLAQCLTHWLPENRWTIRLRGMLVRPFLGHCGKNLTMARAVTFLTPSQIRIGDNVYIATGCWIDGIGGLVIEDEVKLSPFVVVTTSSHCFRNNSVYAGGARIGSVRIGKGSWVASHVTVVAGCTIGSGCIIGANSVVTKNVPDNMFAGGVPARIIGPRVDKEATIFSRMDLDRLRKEGQ
jgi:acetyltransferase-like isoleucine patch superfamily enzyme